MVTVKCSFAVMSRSLLTFWMRSYEAVPGLGIFSETTSTNWQTLGHTSMALSATARFSTHPCPQNGSGKRSQKSSLHAGTLWNSMCSALYTFPFSHTLIPPNSLACSSWKRSRNLKFTFGPSIETETRFHSIQYVFRPWVSHELWAKVVRLKLSILLESQVQIHLFGFCSHVQTFVEYHHKFFCSTHRGHELLLEI